MNQEFYQAIIDEQTIHIKHPEYFRDERYEYRTSFDMKSLPEPTPENLSMLAKMLPTFSFDRYVPDLFNKQNKNKILDAIFHAYGATLSIMYFHKFKDCPQGLRTSMFGCLSNPLSKYIDNFLLVRESDHKQYDPANNDKTGECYRYRANEISMELFARILIASGYTPKPLSVSQINRKNKNLNRTEKELEAINCINPRAEFSDVVYKSIEEFEAEAKSYLVSDDWESQKDGLHSLYFIANFGDEIMNGFKYNTTKHCPRLFHIAQNLRKDIKHKLFTSVGFAFDYDVQSAAPTMLYEAAISVDPTLHDKIPTIREYIQDTKSIRSRISDEVGVSYDKVKRIINARFAGAHLTVNKEHSLFQLVNYDYEIMEKLKNDKFFVELKGELNLLWDSLRKSVKYGSSFDKKGRMKSKQKWRFYFTLETNFIKFVEEYCRSNNIRTFLEHDGFRTDMPIDTDAMVEAYRNKYGFTLKIVSSKLNPCSFNEFHAKVNNLSSNKIVTLMDENGLILNTGKAITSDTKSLHDIKTLVKKSIKEDSDTDLKEFFGELFFQIQEGNIKGYSSEDLIEELSNSEDFMGSSSTRHLLEDNKKPHANLTPIDSIVTMMVDGMKINVPSMRRTSRTTRQTG